MIPSTVRTAGLNRSTNPTVAGIPASCAAAMTSSTLLQVRAEGLFYEEGDACIDRLERPAGMGVGRRRDDDGVDLVERTWRDERFRPVACADALAKRARPDRRPI